MTEFINKQTAVSDIMAAYADGRIVTCEDAAKVLTLVPAADVELIRHAAWVGKSPKKHCSACGAFAKWQNSDGPWWEEALTTYCPACGAKMDLIGGQG